MTQTEYHIPPCPRCNAMNGVLLSDGNRLCFDCRHEWNPDEVPRLRAVPGPRSGDDVPPPVAATAPPDVQPPPAATDPLDAILGPPESVRAAIEAQAVLDELVGTQVVLEGGQLATLAGFPDDDHAEVIIAHDDGTERTEVVELGDVLRSVSAPPPVIDVPDETAMALASVNLTVAGLVLRAGLASVAGEYPNAELLTPPSGWLPLDADGLPALEQGCAYAVAFLIHAYKIDRDQVAAIADTLIGASESLTPTKGGNDQ